MKNLLTKDQMIFQLKQDGFAHVYEWIDKPNTEYAPHAHKGRVSFYLTAGDLVMHIDGKIISVCAGERMDVPVGITHTAKVGSGGCTFIVGEDIEGDA